MNIDNLTNNSIIDDWDAIIAADDYSTPIPSGTYEAEAVKGECGTNHNNTDEYVITWKLTKGEHKGRHLWSHFYLTPKAAPMTKRELTRLGITSPKQNVPAGTICRLQVVLRQTDNATYYNDVKRFDVLRVEPQEQDPFAPTKEPEVVAPATSDSFDELEQDPEFLKRRAEQRRQYVLSMNARKVYGDDDHDPTEEEWLAQQEAEAKRKGEE